MKKKAIPAQVQPVVSRGTIYRIRKRWNRPGYSAAFKILRVNPKSATIRIQHLSEELRLWPTVWPDKPEETITLKEFRRRIRFWKLG